MKMKIAVTAALLTMAHAAASQDDASDCALSYDTFEASVPHTDLQECPASMQIEGAFCRISVVAEVATIFAFSEESFCLVESRSYYDDEFTLAVN
jgi:hypothetical protein